MWFLGSHLKKKDKFHLTINNNIIKTKTFNLPGGNSTMTKYPNKYNCSEPPK